MMIIIIIISLLTDGTHKILKQSGVVEIRNSKVISDIHWYFRYIPVQFGILSGTKQRWLASTYKIDSPNLYLKNYDPSIGTFSFNMHIFGP